MKYSQIVDKHLGKILVAPALIGLFFVVLYPLIMNILMGFQEMKLTNPDGAGWIGLANYAAVFSDPAFHKALRNTFIWTIGGVLMQMGIALPIALLLNIELKGKGFYRGAMLIPWIMPSVVAAYTWVWMYDGSFGIINSIMIDLGLINEAIIWLGNKNTALFAVMVQNTWKGFPFAMVMLLASLQTIPKELYEAAEVDGANLWQRFTRITFPQIMPTFMLSTVFITIWTFNSFENIWLMTEGGPLNASDTLTTYVYKIAFQSFDLGKASSSAMVMFGLLMTVIIFYAWYYTKQQEVR